MSTITSLKSKAASIARRIANGISNSQKTGKEKRTKQFYEAGLQLVESYWASYLKVHDDLCDQASDKDIEEDDYFTTDAYGDIERAYAETIAWLSEQIAELQSSDISNAMPVNSTCVAPAASPSRSINLPKINLPVFTGSYLEWPTFRDTYTTLIHDNADVPDIQKMHYLRSSLSGEAIKVIQHLSITSTSYESAWELLNARYENLRVLVNTNLLALVNLAAMSSESATELRRVLDNFTQSVRALNNLQRPVDQWDDWLVHFLANKLDPSTRKDWEITLKKSTAIPTFLSLTEFLEARIHTLNAIKNSNPGEKRVRDQLKHPKATMSRSHFTSSKGCPGCNEKHFLLFCPIFKAKTTDDRIQFVRNKKLCSNCLKASHDVTACASANRCQKCHQKHHTMLHTDIAQRLDIAASSRNQMTATGHSPLPNTIQTHLANNMEYTRSPVLLATAVVGVRSKDNRLIQARALLDQGSESCFITSKLANSLRLPKTRTKVTITGIGGCEAGVAETMTVHDIVSAVDTRYTYAVQSFVLPCLTQLLPTQRIATSDWPHIIGLQLADPHFKTPDRIDLILGAEVYANIIRDEIRRGPIGTPVAQLTTLGWILSGGIHQTKPSQSFCVSTHASMVDIDKSLRRFWEVENAPKRQSLTAEDQQCEAFFEKTHYRTDGGRYVVRLPIKTDKPQLGNSRQAAVSMLHRMEHRLMRNAELKESYSSFMREYLELHHMEELADGHDDGHPTFYLPHHAVIKPSSTTTKLRVVFNASQKTTSGSLLNDLLHVGPKLQNDIFSVLLKWRLYPFVFSGDIEKMYRQILLDRADADFQRILWRESFHEPIKTFRLLTVTYGTACAPYLACRVLLQLANDHQESFPAAAQILRHNFYVDDALFGAFSEESAIALRRELTHLLQLGGFKLRKWLSNHAQLIEDIPTADKELDNQLKIVSDPQIKTLGIHWNPAKDTFSCPVKLPTTSSQTKRSVLSDISRIYDPLGWLSPCTVKFKVFLQQLWLAKLNWDDELCDTLRTTWANYREDIGRLSTIELDRWIGVTGSQLGLELHGFCDASLAAYSAVVYARIIHEFNTVQVSLLAAKTRVSPLKTISLPKLELCGAALLGELIHTIQQFLPAFKEVPVHTWTDSTIVLAWLREHPSKWKVFVANRVSTIHEWIPTAVWHHIPSEQNPADCVSRGLSVEQLSTFSLWWTGPSWLKHSSQQWPHSTPGADKTALQEEVRQSTALTCMSTDPNSDLLYRFSNLPKLLRVTAYCLRFRQANGPRANRHSGALSSAEINLALQRWIKLAQACAFNAELSCIKATRDLPRTSKLRTLNTLLDQEGILRVGGRLTHSFLSADEKYPIILPSKHQLTLLIIRQAHLSTLHGGIQLTLHQLRTKYWILRGRSTVRQVVRSCVTCTRYQAKTLTPFMGDVPSMRVQPAKPFLKAGVDYASPFSLRSFKGRGQKVYKGYVAVFICLVTRAIHLELVMDLTSTAFVAAFKRFVSRRGRCSHLFSDNATCFTAANKELSTHFQQLKDDPTVALYILQDGTDWSFIPPAAPHCGGLWEAGVKSLKYHLRRVVGDQILTIEEILTLLAQIEACLNSRPLSAFSDDPTDLTAITPGHFLVGENILTVPAPSVLENRKQHLPRWDLVQHMYEDLWKRWQKDYLHTLQSRNKWFHQGETLKIHDLVLVKDERLPPSKWALGRVTEVHRGTDGIVRVATVRCKDGHIKRPLTKLCLLPVDPSTRP